MIDTEPYGGKGEERIYGRNEVTASRLAKLLVGAIVRKIDNAGKVVPDGKPGPSGFPCDSKGSALFLHRS